MTWMLLAEAALLVVTLLVVRAGGYRLVRQDKGVPIATPINGRKLTVPPRELPKYQAACGRR